MSEIAKLYNDVMAGVEAEKLAADQTADQVAYDIQNDENQDGGVEINAEFFSKVASGDEEAVEVMNNFIEEARAEGASDDEIEAAIAEAMQEAGVEDIEAYDEEEASDDVDDEFEVQKAAAYLEGAETAINDALESELAKEAGVTIDDLVEYELGAHYGTGYAETRAGIDVVIEKIAVHKQMEKEANVRQMLGRAGSAIKGGAKSVAQGVENLGYMAQAPGAAKDALKESLKTQGLKGTLKANKKELAALGAGGAALAGAGGAGYMAGRRKK